MLMDFDIDINADNDYNHDSSDVLWSPDPKRVTNSKLIHYMTWLKSKKNLGFEGYQDLWRWSVDEHEKRERAVLRPLALLAVMGGKYPSSGSTSECNFCGCYKLKLNSHASDFVPVRRTTPLSCPCSF